MQSPGRDLCKGARGPLEGAGGPGGGVAGAPRAAVSVAGGAEFTLTDRRAKLRPLNKKRHQRASTCVWRSFATRPCVN